VIRSGDQLFDVAVLGGGPAGVAAALGLSRLGYLTAVVSRTRPSGVEGLSPRALLSLREAGLGSAAECASEAGTRVVWWAGEISERGQEYLIEREPFEARLCDSLRTAPVNWLEASVRSIHCASDAWEVDTTRGSIRSRVVLDARGRYARRSDCRGPLLVAWRVTQLSAGCSVPSSAVAALDDGWCWLARTGNGILSLQFVGSADKPLCRQQLRAKIQALADVLPAFQPEVDLLLGAETIHPRAAVARYSQPSRGPGFLRIGDAAVAMDPLSGNGVHEAIRSGRVAVAAVNSYLRGTQWSVVARFIDDRARELWRRSVGAAAGFYRLQAKGSGGEFWTQTAAAYERAAQEAAIRHEGSGHFEMRPVLDGDSIELRRVWVCADWPRGVWKVDGRSLDQARVEQIPSLLRRVAGVSRHEV
jgi:flavin-dependent dehydrogenase